MDIVAVLTKVVQKQERVMEEQERVNQEQQEVTARLSAELSALKREMRLGANY